MPTADNQSKPKPIKDELEELKQAEKRVADLKRQLLEAPSSIINKEVLKGDSLSFLIAFVQGIHFAIPVTLVEEVIEMVGTHTMTDSIPEIIGLIDYHGELIALFDFAQLAGMQEEPITPDNTIIICTANEKKFAIMVNDVVDVVFAAKKHVQISDQIFSGIMREIAVLKIETGSFSIIDLWSSVLALSEKQITHEHEKKPISNKVSN